MNDQLQQLNISYLAKEDRLLFKARIGTNTEFRIWFTRRFTGLLLKLLEEKMKSFGGAEAIAVSKDTQQVIKQGAFDKKYEEPQVPEFPFGENGFVACQIKSGTDKAGNLHLQILPERGQGMNLRMDKKLLFMLHNLVVQGITHANWNLNHSVALPEEIH